MEYIIDAYNVIKSSRLKKLNEDYARDEFIRILISYKRRHNHIRFVVVFDGSAPQHVKYDNQDRIRFMFSGVITADEVIRQLLERRGAERNTKSIVVSNDREVRSAGRILGSGVTGVELFIDMVTPQVKTFKKVENKGKTIDYNGASKIKKELEQYYLKEK